MLNLIEVIQHSFGHQRFARTHRRKNENSFWIYGDIIWILDGLVKEVFYTNAIFSLFM